MTPEEIKALVETIVKAQMAGGLKAGFETFREFFVEQLSPLVDRLDGIEASSKKDKPEPKETEPKTAEDEMSDPANKALLERLARMEAKEQEREQVANRERFQAALRKELSPENPLHASVVEELLSGRLNSLVENNGVFYNDKGETLGELVRGFFDTPEGQHFKPAKSKQGTGEIPKTTLPVSAPKAEPTVEDMLATMAI